MKKTLPSKSTLNQPYQIISNWGIIKNLRQYNEHCQVMYVDEQVGDGYFENYDFGSLNLARLNCRFYNRHRLTNHTSRQGYWLFIILQGQYQLSSFHDDNLHTFQAPCIFLLKGDMGEMTASIANDMLIQSFYIEFSNEYFEKLQQQLQHNPNYDDSILRYFFNLTEPYCFIPLTFPVNTLQAESKTNTNTNTKIDTISNGNNVQPLGKANPMVAKIMKQSWQLFRTPIPTDEISLMTLQGVTFSFVSELLMQSYSKLYQLNLNFNLNLNLNFNVTQPTEDDLTALTGQTKNMPKHANTNFYPSTKQSTSQLTKSYQASTNRQPITNHQPITDCQASTTDNKHALYAIQAKLLIDQFYYKNWTIRQLAKKVHTNECYLKRDFKRLTGVTIANYRNQVRMQKALTLLAKELKTTDIANQLGFNSHDYFLKSFKKYYQCLPSEYGDN